MNLIFLIMIFFLGINAKAQLSPISSCLNQKPDQIAHALPNLKEEVCYVYDDILQIEGVFGRISLEALKNSNIKKLYLNSPGGQTSVALSAAEFIRDRGIETFVFEGARCASSCTLIFQAGVIRKAHPSSKFIYHCIGVGQIGARIFQQNCGANLLNLSPTCQTDLTEFIETSIVGTEEHFKNYLIYGAEDIFPILKNSPDDPNWFEHGNFCKKSISLFAEETIPLNVVQELLQ